jgi:flagellar motor switch protein FliG
MKLLMERWNKFLNEEKTTLTQKMDNLVNVMDDKAAELGKDFYTALKAQNKLKDNEIVAVKDMIKSYKTSTTPTDASGQINPDITLDRMDNLARIDPDTFFAYGWS